MRAAWAAAPARKPLVNRCGMVSTRRRTRDRAALRKTARTAGDEPFRRLEGDPNGDDGCCDQADRQAADHGGEGYGERVCRVDQGSALKQRFAQSHQSQRDTQSERLRWRQAFLKQQPQHPPPREQVGDDYQHTGISNKDAKVGGWWLHISLLDGAVSGTLPIFPSGDLSFPFSLSP